MQYRALFTAFLFVCFAFLTQVGAWASGVLPALQAEDLNEQIYQLPSDLPADKTLLLIAYKREQQQDLNTWIDGMGLKTSSAPWLELPVLEDYGSWFKWFVDNGMRRGIKSEFDRSKVVTVYTDKQAFNASMGIATEETVYLAVVSRQGQVLALEEGLFNPEAAGRLFEVLKAP